MSIVPTPHIAATLQDIAPAVLMPGDPLRSKWIAETFLEEARLVNNIRGVQGYTGTYKGRPVTVMASGIGIPSISIYAYELFNFYNVDLIIRTGTAGSVQPYVKVRDVIIADTAFTDSCFMHSFRLPEDYIPAADPKSLALAKELVEKEMSGAVCHIGPVLTEEIYYSQTPNAVELWAGRGALAFEMEAAALYANAAQAGKRALSVFTVSNNIITGEEMPPEDRERSLVDMTKLALEIAIR